MDVVARLQLQGHVGIQGPHGRSPHVHRVPADDAAPAQVGALVEQREGQGPGRERKQGRRRVDVDGRGRENEPSHLVGKSRGVDHRHDAALAEPDQVDRTTDLVNRDVEVGEIVVDGQQAHIYGGGSPIGDEKPAAAVLCECLHQTVPRGEVG